MKPSALITLLIVPLILGSAQTPPTSITYAPKPGPGQGRHIVFLTGDEEYRGEEGLPMLAKILSQRHGFKAQCCSPSIRTARSIRRATTSLSDPATLDTADAVVMLLRFRTWPDEDHGAIRHASCARENPSSRCGRARTHSTVFRKGSRWESWNYNNDGGFGKRVLGETWLTHWGRAQDRSDSRDRWNRRRRNHPLLRGVAGDLRRHRRLRSLPASRRDDPRPRSRAEEIDARRQPPRTTASRARPTSRNRASTIRRCPWCGRALNKNDTGTTNRILTTTMGSATDLENEGLRRPDREWRVLGPRDGRSCGS